MADHRTLDFNTDSVPVMWIAVLGDKPSNDRQAVCPTVHSANSWHLLSLADALKGWLIKMLAHDRLPAIAGQLKNLGGLTELCTARNIFRHLHRRSRMNIS